MTDEEAQQLLDYLESAFIRGEVVLVPGRDKRFGISMQVVCGYRVEGDHVLAGPLAMLLEDPDPSWLELTLPAAKLPYGAKRAMQLLNERGLPSEEVTEAVEKADQQFAEHFRLKD